jgi:hypothetical protein
MPYFGDPKAPAHSHLMPEYMSDTVPDVRQPAEHETDAAESDEHTEIHPGETHDRAAHDRAAHDRAAHDSAAHHGVGVPNIITAVLASYRGYDTLGETVVIFTAGIGVLLLLRGRRNAADAEGEVE